MRALKSSMLALGLMFGFPHAGQSQIINILGPTPIIAGVRLQCNGAISYVANISDIAMATPGQLLFRPDFFFLPPTIQWFIYTHECAHQVVGSNENAADCWAIKLGRNQGFFSLQALNQICGYTFPSPGDWTHLPGPARCAQMAMCYRTP